MKIVRFVAALLLATAGLGALATSAGAYPANQIATAQINATVFTPGQTVTVTIQHATPGGVLTMTLFSSPVVIASGPVIGADTNGSISGQIPAGTALGAHTVTVNSSAGEAFTFSIVVVTNNPGGGCNLVIDPPTGQAVDAHTVRFSISRCIGQNQVATATLSDGEWTASATVSTNRNGYATFNDVVVSDPDHSLPTGSSQVFVSVSAPNGAGGGGAFDIMVSGGTSTPPTNTPTTPPSGNPTTTATATGTIAGGTRGAGSGSGAGGTLASTGAQVGPGAGLGAVALLGGGVLLLASRRRSTPRHGA